jgi:phage shock protein A
MALINRVARLFRADMHAVLDRLEEPEVVLRQAVREMEDSLDQDRQRLKALSLELGQLTSRLADLDRSDQELEGELDLCFAAAKDDLARALIRRRLEGEQLRRVLTSKRESLDAQRAALQTRVHEHQGRLEAMRQTAELLAAEQPAAETDERWPGAPEFSVRAEDVEVAFLREKHQRSQTP